jgi:hypothetical protein
MTYLLLRITLFEIYFLYARLETGRIMWLDMTGGRASTQVSAQ